MAEYEDDFRAFLEYDPDKLAGKKITAGKGPGQLPKRVFNAIMRNNFSTTGLRHLHVTDEHDFIDAQALASISSEELQLFVNSLGEKGAEAVKKAINELLEQENH